MEIIVWGELTQWTGSLNESFFLNCTIYNYYKISYAIYYCYIAIIFTVILLIFIQYLYYLLLFCALSYSAIHTFIFKFCNFFWQILSDVLYFFGSSSLFLYFLIAFLFLFPSQIFLSFSRSSWIFILFREPLFSILHL